MMVALLIGGLQLNINKSVVGDILKEVVERRDDLAHTALAVFLHYQREFNYF
jgi:plasmid maintenance system antidote protein VapI